MTADFGGIGGGEHRGGAADSGDLWPECDGAGVEIPRQHSEHPCPLRSGFRFQCPATGIIQLR